MKIPILNKDYCKNEDWFKTFRINFCIVLNFQYETFKYFSETYEICSLVK